MTEQQQHNDPTATRPTPADPFPTTSTTIPTPADAATRADLDAAVARDDVAAVNRLAPQVLAQQPLEVDTKTSGAQVEASGVERVAFEWRGHALTMPASMDDWPIAAQLAFEEGKPATGVRGVLGPQQFALLIAAGYVNRDLNELSQQMLNVLGLGDLGE